MDKSKLYIDLSQMEVGDVIEVPLEEDRYLQQITIHGVWRKFCAENKKQIRIKTKSHKMGGVFKITRVA